MTRCGTGISDKQCWQAGNESAVRILSNCITPSRGAWCIISFRSLLCLMRKCLDFPLCSEEADHRMLITTMDPTQPFQSSRDRGLFTPWLHPSREHSWCPWGWKAGPAALHRNSLKKDSPTAPISQNVPREHKQTHRQMVAFLLLNSWTVAFVAAQRGHAQSCASTSKAKERFLESTS